MKRTKLFTLFFVVTILASSITSCVKERSDSEKPLSQEELLVGSWKMQDIDDDSASLVSYWHFNSDKTYQMAEVLYGGKAIYNRNKVMSNGSTYGTWQIDKDTIEIFQLLGPSEDADSLRFSYHILNLTEDTLRFELFDIENRRCEHTFTRINK